jgi:hypothetical protein
VQGKLADFNLGELLQLFALSEKSGTVTVSYDNRQSRLLLEAGRVVGWGLEDFDVHAAILACHFLSPPSLAAIESIEPEPGTPGLGFVVRNLVDPDRWACFVQRLLEQDIYDILDLENGDFEIVIGRIPPIPLSLDLSVQQLILDGSRWQADSAGLAQEGFGVRSRWARALDDESAQDLELSQRDWLILSALTETRSLGDVASMICQSDLDTAEAMKGLYRRGIVQRESAIS